MLLLWQRLDGRSGHDVGRELLERGYRQETGEEMPPVRTDGRGKPHFTEGPYHFSISHTGCHAFCCLSLGNVGLDAEETDRQIDLRVARRYLSEAEQARIASAADIRIALLKMWVLKESYAKLTGRGLGNYLKETDFSPEDPRIHIIDGCFVAVMEE